MRLQTLQATTGMASLLATIAIIVIPWLVGAAVIVEWIFN